MLFIPNFLNVAIVPALYDGRLHGSKAYMDTYFATALLLELRVTASMPVRACSPIT